MSPHVVVALVDEIAFWDSDESAANRDAEIVNALRPAMATVDGALLLGLSSPYSRRGELWRMYERYWGVNDSDVLVWQAGTRTMNPTVPQSLIDRALAEDEPAARAEYFAEWRRDIEQFVSREVLDAVTVPDRGELPAATGVQYVAFVDPSGGASDSMTLGIAHRSNDGRIVLDCVREVRAPFDPAVVVQDFATVLRSYRLSEVTSDYYGGEWVVSAFRTHGIHVRTSDKPKSDIYKTLIPLLTSGSVELLDLSVLRAQSSRSSGGLDGAVRKSSTTHRDTETTLSTRHQARLSKHTRAQLADRSSRPSGRTARGSGGTGVRNPMVVGTSARRCSNYASRRRDAASKRERCNYNSKPSIAAHKHSGRSLMTQGRP